MKLSDGDWRIGAMLSVAILSLTLAGCAQREVTPAAEETATAGQQLPFEAASDKSGIFPTGSLLPTAIPLGTPLEVHLRMPLSSATARTDDAFEAVLDEPIVVRGQTVAQRGAILRGKVLDARASGESEDAGYMRLALTAIYLKDKSFPIQTSSIFVKRGLHGRRDSTVISGPIGPASISQASATRATTGGSSRNGKSTLMVASTGTAPRASTSYVREKEDVGVAADRTLTFRLAQPLALDF